MRKSAADYLKEPYSRVLIPVDKSVFFAEILEFPGCYAEGKNPTEAFKSLERAAKAWIKTALLSGQTIPEPAKNIGYSGKVVLRLPKSLHRRAAQFASRDGVSLNHFFTTAIASQVGAQEFARQLVASFSRSFVHVMQQYNVAVTNITNPNFTVNYAIPSAAGFEGSGTVQQVTQGG